MTTHSLAALIGSLTHSVDRLEVLLAKSPYWIGTLASEIDNLHALIDDMNVAYVDLEDKEQDTAFEAVGR